MFKKICSIIAIVFTATYVFSTLYMNKQDDRPRATYDEVKQDSDVSVSTKSAEKTSVNSQNETVNKKVVQTETTSNQAKTDKTNVVNSKNTYKLTDSDKERLMEIAKKLSPIDREKINTYLDSKEDGESIKAINLLRDRISDKEYDKIRDIGEHYNNT